MKALSVHPYYAAQILVGNKTIECRTWKTDYRGDIVICSTRQLMKDTIPSHALCVVRIADIVPFTRKHLDDACMEAGDYRPGMYAWILEDVRPIVPVPVKGKLSLWDYTGSVEYIAPAETEEEDKAQYEKYWKPLMV